MDYKEFEAIHHLNDGPDDNNFNLVQLNFALITYTSVKFLYSINTTHHFERVARFLKWQWRQQTYHCEKFDTILTNSSDVELCEKNVLIGLTKQK